MRESWRITNTNYASCGPSFSYIFYILQSLNLYLSEKGFFYRRFRRLEGRLQKNFLQIKVEEDLKFLLAQIMLKYSKKRGETAAAPVYYPMSPCWPSARPCPKYVKVFLHTGFSFIVAL